MKSQCFCKYNFCEQNYKNRVPEHCICLSLVAQTDSPANVAFLVWSMKEIATQGVSKMAIEWREYALKD